MKLTMGKPKQARKKRGVGSAFLKEAGKTSWVAVLGFAMCQCWLALCFFAPQLFPENSTFRVYEMSLVVCAVSLIPGIVAARKVEEFVHRKRAIFPMAAVAAFGTVLVPLSVVDGRTVPVVMGLAALLTGFGSAWMFIAWYRAFCQMKDSVGFVLSVAAQSLLIYVLSNIFLPPAFSPWIMVAIAAVLPLLSALCLASVQSESPISSLTHEITALTRPQALSMLRLCASMFVISFACEFMRNQYLGGTDLQYYAETVNLAMLVLKLIFSVLIVVWVSSKLDRVPILYKASFILIVAAMLFMPYLVPSVGYAITNFGAFFFKIVVMLVAFHYSQSHKLSPVLVFSLTRMTWALDLLFAYGCFGLFQHFEPAVEGLLGLVSATLGLVIFITYLFVMTDLGGQATLVGTRARKPQGTGELQTRCEALAATGKLSKREKEVLELIARGRSAPRIQEELSLSINTVNSHISHIYRKLGVNSRQELLDLIEVSTGSAGK